MTATLADTDTPAPAQRHLLRDLEHPRDAFSNVTPNWFAAVMGTGIVAVAASSLPEQFPGLHVIATVVWLAAAALLVGLGWLTLQHWRHHRVAARGHLDNPVMAHFYGAPPMALMTVGTATLLLGPDVIGTTWAVGIDWVLWTAGTIGGLVTAALVPLRMFTQHTARASDAFGGWLMPIVPPMVSASAGALLVPHAPAGQLRLTLLLACYAMFGLSLLASVVVITLIWFRLATAGVGEAKMVPTLWIVLGPLGQSITAANLLGTNAHLAVPAPDADALHAFGLLYGLPVWGFAMLWATLATTITVRTVRAGMPFSLTWWSFTFPVGTVVTGTTGLALHTGADVFRWAAAAFFAGLVLAWVTVALRTFHGAVVRGYLLAPPA